MPKISLIPGLASSFVGVFLGLGWTVLDYSDGLSYLGSDPQACANCHIMRYHYDSWLKASHHSSATCVDCHLPAGFAEKYFAKAVNGWNHSKAFTLQDFHEPIMMKEENADILQANCLRCHGGLVYQQALPYAGDAPRCVRCHSSVGHGEPVGLGGPMDSSFDRNMED